MFTVTDPKDAVSQTDLTLRRVQRLKVKSVWFLGVGNEKLSTEYNFGPIVFWSKIDSGRF